MKTNCLYDKELSVCQRVCYGIFLTPSNKQALLGTYWIDISFEVPLVFCKIATAQRCSREK
jgi:hypothetical protein